MDEAKSESSIPIFQAFNKGEYQVISDYCENISKSAADSGSEEDVEAASKQVTMVNTLVEYFKDGAKDPKKAYKSLSDIENGDVVDDKTDINYLLEYNCGVFAYLSQMNDKALDHFKKIMKYNDDAELFLVIKSAFITLQILTDNQQVESAKVVIRKLEEMLPILERISELKKNYRSDILSEKNNDGQKSSKKFKGLNLHYFSISCGSFIQSAAKSPKNPCITEYRFFLLYFKSRIAVLDCDNETRTKWVKLLSSSYDEIRKHHPENLGCMEDVVMSQCAALVPYMNSFSALQDPQKDVRDQQNSIRLISFSDRDLGRNPAVHPSSYKMIKETDKRKEQIIQNCNQKHPLYFFNNLGVLHLNTKKYSIAAYFLSKALRYLSLDGKQNAKVDMNTALITNHTTQKRAEIMHNLGLAFYKLQEYEKAMNCFSESNELYCDKHTMWFWMGVCSVKYYMIMVEKISLDPENNDNGLYGNKFNYPFPYNLNKPSHAKSKKSKIAMSKRPDIFEINEKTPEKLQLDSGIKYFDNLILAYQKFNQKQSENVSYLEDLDLKNMVGNIPKIFNDRPEEEKLPSKFDADMPYSQGLHERNRNERYHKMVKMAYLFQVYCYLVLNNLDKALEKAKILKSEYKLNSKTKFELNMYLAEIYIKQNSPDLAMKCLRVDQAFEEAKDSSVGKDGNGNVITVENVITGIKEKKLPKQSVMWLNIAT